jgi:hypothetical protein
MPAHSTDILRFPVSSKIKRDFEQAAARLNLSPSAYLLYLMNRAKPGTDAARFDRMVDEVFGRYGPAMKKLSE